MQLKNKKSVFSVSNNHLLYALKALKSRRYLGFPEVRRPRVKNVFCIKQTTEISQITCVKLFTPPIGLLEVAFLTV